MALIRCPECGKEVSDTIESCIHCGFVLKKEEEKPAETKKEEAAKTFDGKEPTKTYYYVEDKKSEKTKENKSNEGFGMFKTFSIIILAMALFMILIFSCSVNLPRESTPAPKEVLTVESAGDFMEILAEYRKNEVSAKEKYGQYILKIAIPGEILKIGELGIDVVYDDIVVNVIDSDGEYLYKREVKIFAYFEKSQIETVKKLSSGDQVIVSGQFDMINGHVMYLKNCSFEVVKEK